ncbi:MAG: TRAP transporter small permease subunit [Rhodobacterales bacterium]|nr:TRAP transporter small permease subunit [Rhodobacterales bacterium]
MIPKTLSKLSAGVSVVERFTLKLLIAVLTLTVLMNVLLRMVGITLAWADEAGVYAMVLSGFVGASLMLRARIDPAVLLLHEFLPPKACRALRTAVSVVSAVFGITLLYLCVRWFDPAGIARAGFDVMAFQGATFNFIYTDVTPVMGAPAYLFYLIIPLFGLTITIHALTNLCEDLGLVARPVDPAGLAMDVVQ